MNFILFQSTKSLEGEENHMGNTEWTDIVKKTKGKKDTFLHQIDTQIAEE